MARSKRIYFRTPMAWHGTGELSSLGQAERSLPRTDLRPQSFFGHCSGDRSHRAFPVCFIFFLGHFCRLEKVAGGAGYFFTGAFFCSDTFFRPCIFLKTLFLFPCLSYFSPAYGSEGS